VTISGALWVTADTIRRTLPPTKIPRIDADPGWKPTLKKAWLTGKAHIDDDRALILDPS
jgi:hypothetical protein